MNTKRKIIAEKYGEFEDFRADQGKAWTIRWWYCTTQQTSLGGAWAELQERESLS